MAKTVLTAATQVPAPRTIPVLEAASAHARATEANRRATPQLGPLRRAAPIARNAVEATAPHEPIRLTIGRIEIRAAPPAAPAPSSAPAKPAGPRMTLQDYLAVREKG